MQRRRRLPLSREEKYPNLHDNPESYEVHSEETPRRDYNCAAWALEITDAIWWPLPSAPEYYWPEGARRDDTLEAFAEGYRLYDFEICDTPDLEEGYIKIAVFADGDEPLHVARQLPDGRWTSKLGLTWEDIIHDNLEGVSRPDYGRPRLFMRKRVAEQEEQAQEAAPQA